MGSNAYPYSLAPNSFKIKVSQLPLNPVWPVIVLFYFPKILPIKLDVIQFFFISTFNNFVIFFTN